MTVNWVLIIGGAVLILIEVLLGAATGFDFLLIGSALVLGGVLGLFVNSATLGLAAAGALALLYVFLGRRHVRNRFGRPGLSSNTDVLIGKTVRVVEPIRTGHPGRVKYEGEEWRAELTQPSQTTLESGKDARIVRIDGVTVFVEPI
jgi:membrane protein implicated in regulation of membrane protease activity